jgi:hypothetical protein
MPDLFGAWTRRWLFDVGPGTSAVGRTRIVSALLHKGGRLVAPTSEATEIAFGSRLLYRLLGLFSPAAVIPILARVAPQPTTDRTSVSVIVLSNPGFYAFSIRPLSDWGYSRASDRVRSIVLATTGFPLIASSHTSDVPHVRREMSPDVVLQGFLSDVACEPRIDAALQRVAVAAFDALQTQDIKQAVILTCQVIETIRQRPREDDIRHLAEKSLNVYLDQLGDRKVQPPPNVP